MFGISSYWRNDLRGKFRYTEACSVAHHSCLNRRENCSLLEQLPPQTSSPQAACWQPCQQPVPLRGSGSDSCPGLKHLPGRLPKRPGPHPLESRLSRLGLDVKRKNMEKHEWEQLQEQYHLQTLLATASSVYGLAKGGGFEDSEEGRRPNSVQFSHSLWWVMCHWAWYLEKFLMHVSLQNQWTPK